MFRDSTVDRSSPARRSASVAPPRVQSHSRFHRSLGQRVEGELELTERLRQRMPLGFEPIQHRVDLWIERVGRGALGTG